MSIKAKKYLITTETRKIFIVSNGCREINGFCSVCGKEVETMGLDSAVTITGKRSSEIFHLIEKGKIHSLETDSGHLLICRISLEGETR